jgi:hypothetical protein
MAGSWQHATTKGGKLLNNERFCGMIENLGDAYEMAEEMYGMVWWLARQNVGHLNWENNTDHPVTREQVLDMIAMAERYYKDGLSEGGVQRAR